MTMLYDVYRHPQKGDWAFSVSGQSVDTVEIGTSGVRKTKVSAHLLAAEISKRTRMGYVKLARPLYFMDRLGDGVTNPQGHFVVRHPELLRSGGIVLFTTVSMGDDLEALTTEWEESMSKTDIEPLALSRWIDSIKTAKEYISTPKSHPAFTLVVAQWAFEVGRLVVGEYEGMPSDKPSSAPLDWEAWLGTIFQEKNAVRDSLEDLGWSAQALLVKSAIAEQETKPNDGGWFASARSVAF